MASGRLPSPPKLARGRAIVSFPPPPKSFESRLQGKSTASNKWVISCLVMFQIPNQVGERAKVWEVAVTWSTGLFWQNYICREIQHEADH